MDIQVRKALEVSLMFMEANIDLLSTALSKASASDEKGLDNEKASLVVRRSIDFLESITLSLEEIGEPIEDEIKKTVKEQYENLQQSIDLCTSGSNSLIKEQFQEIREVLKRIEKEHQERRHFVPLDIIGDPAVNGIICATSICD